MPCVDNDANGADIGDLVGSEDETELNRLWDLADGAQIGLSEGRTFLSIMCQKE